MNNEIIVLKRSVPALLIPSGARVWLHAGTEITIAQALGTSWTVHVYGNLARIDALDADVLGGTAPAPPEFPAGTTTEEKVWLQLKTVYDPEIPVNIVDLGLVYTCTVHNEHVLIEMTLTAPGCGMGPVLIEDARRAVLNISEILDADIQLVFDPPWTQDRMSEAARLELGLL